MQWLLRVQTPNWNQGATDAATSGGDVQFPPESQMESSFYAGPDDPPYAWW